MGAGRGLRQAKWNSLWEGRMRSQRFVGSLAALIVFAWATESAACAVCRTDRGKEVRAGIFNDQFGPNLAMTLLPFPVLIAAVALIHFGPPRGMDGLKRESGRPSRVPGESEG